jgi:hypothetical protein
MDLGIRWRGMVRFTPWSLYPQEKNPRMNRRLGGPQNWSGQFGAEENLLSMLEIELQFISLPASSPLTINSYTILALTNVPTENNSYNFLLVEMGVSKLNPFLIHR